jgi:hypothetical protein
MTNRQKLEYLLEAMLSNFKGMGTIMKRHILGEIDDEVLLELLTVRANKISHALDHIRKN